MMKANAKLGFGKTGKTAVIGTLLAAVSLGAAGGAAHAVTVPDRMRVALFVDLGSKYQSLAPAVTLSSAGGMKLTWNGAPIATAAAGNAVRFAVDGYRAKIVETDDLAAALSVLKKVQQSSNAALLIQLPKNGKSVYQVTEGNYASASAASAAVSKWTNAGVAAGVATLSAPAVAGPWAVEAGPYGSEAEASAAAAQFGSLGLDAFVARKLSGDSAPYYVRIGQASDASALTELKTKAAAVGEPLQIPDASEAYVVERNDLTAGGTADSAVPLYAMSSGAKLVAAPANNGNGILVAERSKRTYRGNMEVSVLNGDLALVNDLPLEQYLYSVVGSEVPGTWPLETQKAQAVAARSYAIFSGVGFQIANVVDTTLSQTYNGIGGENANAIAGVEATAGEVLTYQGKVIDAVFSSNAGGMTADNATEIWGSSAPYLASAVQSPDAGPQEGKLEWYKVAMSDGEVGYVRSDYLADSGMKNAAGIALYASTGDGVAVRPSPQTTGTGATPIGQLYRGDTVVVLDKVPEYTNYSWVETFTADQLAASINKKAKSAISGLKTLEVSGRGPSGRVTQIKANGTAVDVGVPDNLRSALGGLKSTLFDIEETGRFTVAGANGAQKNFPTDGSASTLQIQGANGSAVTAGSNNLFILSGDGKLRAATTDAEFVISGQGFGHGLGMSQWGAKALADQGYDYQSILQYYYKNVKIEKDGGE